MLYSYLVSGFSLEAGGIGTGKQGGAYDKWKPVLERPSKPRGASIDAYAETLKDRNINLSQRRNTRMSQLGMVFLVVVGNTKERPEKRRGGSRLSGGNHHNAHPLSVAKLHAKI